MMKMAKGAWPMGNSRKKAKNKADKLRIPMESKRYWADRYSLTSALEKVLPRMS